MFAALWCGWASTTSAWTRRERWTARTGGARRCLRHGGHITHDTWEYGDLIRECTFQDFSPVDVIIHPEYNKPSRFQNDIAVVKLDRDIEINGDTSHVVPHLKLACRLRVPGLPPLHGDAPPHPHPGHRHGPRGGRLGRRGRPRPALCRRPPVCRGPLL